MSTWHSENHTRSKANHLGTKQKDSWNEWSRKRIQELIILAERATEIENQQNSIHSYIFSIFSKAIKFYCLRLLYILGTLPKENNLMEKNANISTKCINICTNSSEFVQSEARGCVLEDITESLSTTLDIQVKATLSTSCEQPGLTILLTCYRMICQYNHSG